MKILAVCLDSPEIGFECAFFEKTYSTVEFAKVDCYIEIFYNRQRRHASQGYVSPVVYEKMHEMNKGRAA